MSYGKHAFAAGVARGCADGLVLAICDAPQPLPRALVTPTPALSCFVQGETFDAAYAMEATCHAPTLEQVRACLCWVACLAALAHCRVCSTLCQSSEAGVQSLVCQPGGHTACAPSAQALTHCCTPTAHAPSAKTSLSLASLPLARPQVYSEVYRVLKPGAIFMTYE